MLEIINNKVEIDPDLMTIPQFKEIWEQDATDGKRKAFALISYIFHFNNPKSPFYRGFPEHVRGGAIVEKLFPEELQDYSFHDDKAFIQATNIYKELLDLSSFRGILELGKKVLYDITQSLKSQGTKPGTKLNNMAKITEAMQEINKAQKMIDEDEVNSRVKGSKTIRNRER